MYSLTNSGQTKSVKHEYEYDIILNCPSIMIVSEYLPLNIPDVGILLPDALEVGELQLEAGEAGREHGVGLCHL